MKDRTSRKKKHYKKDKEISETILRYGEDVLQSEEFRSAYAETHHIRGTVSSHSMTVCIMAMKMSRFLKKQGVDLNDKDLVQASLCHDLGMIGRKEKYQDNIIAWKSHPKDSAAVARDLVPDLSENAESMIATHMWPVGGPIPKSKEALILSTADKLASFADWIQFLTGKSVGAGIRKQVEKSAQLEKTDPESGDSDIT